MADAIHLDRDMLKPLCGDSLAIFRPFGSDGWDCATNGHALLRLRGETLPAPDGQWKPQTASLVSLAENGGHRCETRLGTLRAWARGAGPLHPKCECCDTPQELPYVVTGYIGAAKINVCLLSHYLPDGLPDSPVTVQWGDALAPLLVRAEEWQLVLMPLNPEPEGHRFVFDPEPPRKGYLGADRAAKLPPVGVVTRGWTPMFDAHGQLNVREGEFCIFHAKPKDNDAEGYFCDSLVWDAETSPQWRDGEHGWDIDDVCEFHPMPARGAAAKPPAGVEVAEALDALDSLASSIRCSPREYLEYYKEDVDTIRSALEKCR